MKPLTATALLALSFLGIWESIPYLSPDATHRHLLHGLVLLALSVFVFFIAVCGLICAV